MKGLILLLCIVYLSIQNTEARKLRHKHRHMSYEEPLPAEEKEVDPKEEAAAEAEKVIEDLGEKQKEAQKSPIRPSHTEDEIWTQAMPERWINYPKGGVANHEVKFRGD